MKNTNMSFVYITTIVRSHVPTYNIQTTAAGVSAKSQHNTEKYTLKCIHFGGAAISMLTENQLVEQGKASVLFHKRTLLFGTYLEIIVQPSFKSPRIHLHTPPNPSCSR